MWPFHNKGWVYLSQMESILPVSGAKGCNVFVTSAATSSLQMIANQLNISDAEAEDLPDAIKAARNIKVGGGDGGVGGGDKINDGRVSVDPKISYDKGVVNDSMDIDKGPIKTSVSSSSKWKHSLNAGGLSLTSSHITSVPTTLAPSSEPTSKKVNSLKGKGKQLAGKQTVKSSSSAGKKISTAKAAQILNATVLHGMQGTMNRVLNIFKKSVLQTTDPHLAAWDDTLNLLQTCKDGLTLDNKRRLILLFMKDIVIAQTYNRLTDEDSRQSCIAEMLAAEWWTYLDGLILMDFYMFFDTVVCCLQYFVCPNTRFYGAQNTMHFMTENVFMASQKIYIL
jgi:hypothetical protein